MSPETKKLLERARRHEAAPDAASKERLRRNVLASIATTAGVAATGSASAAGAATTTTVIAGSTSLTALKLGAVGLVVATAGVLTVRGFTSSASAPSEDGRATSQDEGQRAMDADVAKVPPVVSLPTSDSRPIEERALAPTSEAVAPPSAASAKPAPKPSTSVAAEAAPVTAESLDAERALIASARSKLASGDAAGALAALGEHAASHPRGVLASERRALTAIAYCNQGAVSQGLSTFPLPAEGSDSPLSARVRAACVK